MMKRVSVCECAGSRIVMETGSPKTVAASSKLTPCLARFDPALCASHSKVSMTDVELAEAAAANKKGDFVSKGGFVSQNYFKMLLHKSVQLLYFAPALKVE